MTDHSILFQIFVYLSAAVLSVPLAKKLGLPCTPGPAAPPQLVYTERGLELRLRLGGPDTVGASVLRIDFSGGRSGYRHARNCTVKQPLARAIGIRAGMRPTVFDATAGMGADAFVVGRAALPGFDDFAGDGREHRHCQIDNCLGDGNHRNLRKVDEKNAHEGQDGYCL